MRLLLKFNLIFLLIFAAGLAAISQVSWSLLERNARDEIAQSARLLMDAAIATRSYTSGQVAPLLQTQLKYSFLPQTVPAFSATEVFNGLRQKHAEYAYKEAVLNPTNPRNRAVDWETDIVNQFRNNKDTSEIVGDRDTPTGRSFYVARPLRIGNQACLQCHSTVDAAPPTMIERYGPANGFGWKLNEVVGAQIISVPTHVPLDRPTQAFKVFMTSTGDRVRGDRRRAQPDAVDAGDPAGDQAVAVRRPREPGRARDPGVQAHLARRDRRARALDRPHAHQHGPGHEDARQLTLSD